MYVLIFWTVSKEISIVEEDNLCPKKQEGETTFVQYNGKLYKGKIITKSDDEQYLKSLKVDTNGKIIKNNYSSSKEVIAASKVLKRKEKEVNKKKETCKNNLNKRIILSPSIFEDINFPLGASETETATKSMKKTQSEDTSSNLEEPLDELLGEEIERDRTEIWHRERELENSRRWEKEQENNECWEREQEEMHKRVQEETRRLERERRRDREEVRKRGVEGIQNRQREIERELTEVRKRNEEEKERRDLERKREREERRKRLPGNSHDKSPSSDNDEDEDPLEACRKGGNGKVLLCDVYKDVWIDKAHLTYLQRWLEFPREMTRRLLKALVGVQNLKNMCARGRSKKRSAVPEDIINSVEYYVNKKCISRLKPAEFSSVINMMCVSLRHPKV